MQCALVWMRPLPLELLHANVDIEPTFQSVFPLSSTLTIHRTLNTSLTPQPNSTSFGPSGSIYAQL
jgi:hypothetical protein